MSLELTDAPVLEPGDPFPEIPPMSEQPFKCIRRSGGICGRALNVQICMSSLEGL